MSDRTFFAPTIFYSMDLYLFKFINHFAFKWFWLDAFGKFCAGYLGYFLVFFLLLFLAVDFSRHWKMFVQAVVSAVLARLVIVEIIRLFLPRQRPFVVENNVNLLINHSASPSFPSGHAAFFFAVSAIVYFYNKKAGVLFLTSAFLICLARVFVGVHWPSDVIIGAFVGIFSAWVLYFFGKKMSTKNKELKTQEFKF